MQHDAGHTKQRITEHVKANDNNKKNDVERNLKVGGDSSTHSIVPIVATSSLGPLVTSRVCFPNVTSIFARSVRYGPRVAAAARPAGASRPTIAAPPALAAVLNGSPVQMLDLVQNTRAFIHLVVDEGREGDARARCRIGNALALAPLCLISWKNMWG